LLQSEKGGKKREISENTGGYVGPQLIVMAALWYVTTQGRNRWPATSAPCDYLTVSSKGALAAFVDLQDRVTPRLWGSWVITLFVLAQGRACFRRILDCYIASRQLGCYLPFCEIANSPLCWGFRQLITGLAEHWECILQQCYTQ
jgi:hypothetical protein